MKRSLLPLVILLFVGQAFATPGPLPDQYGNTDALANYAQQPMLVIVTSTRKLPHIGRWEKALRQQLPTLVSMRVADINDDPKPSYEQVAMRLQDKAPQNVGILIDLQNTWADSYELDTGEPCLLVFDQNHQLVSQFRGRVNKQLLGEVLTVLQEYF